MNHFNYEQIVIGSDLTAVLFAAKHNIPIIFSKPERPFRFDFFKPDADLSCVKIQNTTKVWKSHNDDESHGIAKELLWERMLFLLSLSGLCPLADICHNINWDGKYLTAHGEHAILMKIAFDRCYYFDTQKKYKILEDRNYGRSSSDFFNVIDWIAFNSGGKHAIELLETKDNFINRVWFYSSDRIDGNTPVKDACCVSFLSEEETEHFDFSETMARFKLISEMKERGMRGLRNGFQKNGKPKYYNFKTSTIRREKYLASAPIWAETDKFKVPQIKEKDLINELPNYISPFKKTIDYL